MNDHPRYRNPPLVVEVAGEFACFTRPEAKAERVSYEVMTPSAARGVLHAIFWKPEFEYIITKIEVLKPISWFSIRRNEVKTMLSQDWLRRAAADTTVRYDVETDRDQRNAVCLREVSYRIYAQVQLQAHATTSESGYREQFRRRVNKGACFSQPFLGTREFSASFGNPTAAPPIALSKQLGIMLHNIHYDESGESYSWFSAALDHGVMQVPRHGLHLPSSRSATGRG